jgi:hypothetical protein
MKNSIEFRLTTLVWAATSMFAFERITISRPSVNASSEGSQNRRIKFAEVVGCPLQRRS